jgi:hypothetical protein
MVQKPWYVKKTKVVRQRNLRTSKKPFVCQPDHSYIKKPFVRQPDRSVTRSHLLPSSFLAVCLAPIALPCPAPSFSTGVPPPISVRPIGVGLGKSMGTEKLRLGSLQTAGRGACLDTSVTFNSSWILLLLGYSKDIKRKISHRC